MKKLQKQANELNDIIFSRNLYSKGRRYINAHHNGKLLMVEDLHTNKSFEFVNDGTFVDGYGKQVII